MRGDVEFAVVRPIGARRGLHWMLAEAVEAQESVAHRRLKASRGKPSPENQHTADHHQIGGTIHAQPSSIDAGHAFWLFRRRRMHRQFRYLADSSFFARRGKVA